MLAAGQLTQMVKRAGSHSPIRREGRLVGGLCGAWMGTSGLLPRGGVLGHPPPNSVAYVGENF